MTLKGRSRKHEWDIYWSPEGRKIATVEAITARQAIRMAPQPYRKYLGEMYAVEHGAVERYLELSNLIDRELISIENGATPQIDERGNTLVGMATCGNCGMSWNDALITGRTPAPSARCPYEYIHAEIAEWKSLKTKVGR